MTRAHRRRSRFADIGRARVPNVTSRKKEVGSSKGVTSIDFHAVSARLRCGRLLVRHLPRTSPQHGRAHPLSPFSCHGKALQLLYCNSTHRSSSGLVANGTRAAEEQHARRPTATTKTLWYILSLKTKLGEGGVWGAGIERPTYGLEEELALCTSGRRKREAGGSADPLLPLNAKCKTTLRPNSLLSLLPTPAF